jgi:hypothetical protein
VSLSRPHWLNQLSARLLSLIDTTGCDSKSSPCESDVGVGVGIQLRIVLLRDSTASAVDNGRHRASLANGMQGVVVRRTLSHCMPRTACFGRKTWPMACHHRTAIACPSPLSQVVFCIFGPYDLAANKRSAPNASICEGIQSNSVAKTLNP